MLPTNSLDVRARTPAPFTVVETLLDFQLLSNGSSSGLLESVFYLPGRLYSLSRQAQPGHRIDSLYGYIPTESVCIVFVVLFSISTRKYPLIREASSQFIRSSSHSCFSSHPLQTLVALPYCYPSRTWRGHRLDRSPMVKSKSCKFGSFPHAVRPFWK